MQKGDGFANQCVKNAFDNLDLSIGVKIICGWLVGKPNEKNNLCVIHPHFWNVDALGNYFDTTPLANEIYTYVVDQGLAFYGQENLELLSSLVCYSLIQCGDEYTAFEIIQGKDVQHKIADLSNSNIFKFKQTPHLTPPTPHFTSAIIGETLLQQGRSSVSP